MNPAERQLQIFAFVCEQGLTPFKKLADVFVVSYQTICRDVVAMTSRYPLIVVRGRNGGVKLEDWFVPTSPHLSVVQLQWLMKMIDIVPADEKSIANSIILQFSPHGYILSP